MTRYLTGSFQTSERLWIAVAALVLLPVFFLPVLPVWTMKLWAPQYPEGLQLTIYAHTIQGDLDKINTLNHYVGMHAITPNDFDEFRYMPQLLTFFGVMALLAALVNRRWLAILGWLGFTAFAIYMFRDLRGLALPLRPRPESPGGHQARCLHASADRVQADGELQGVESARPGDAAPRIRVAPGAGGGSGSSTARRERRRPSRRPVEQRFRHERPPGGQYLGCSEWSSSRAAWSRRARSVPSVGPGPPRAPVA
jgi:hypothetical protein